MIQEIFPRHFDNQYRNCVPKSGDSVLIYEAGGALVRKCEVDEISQGGVVSIKAGEVTDELTEAGFELPTYELVEELTKKAEDTLAQQMGYEYIYLFSIDDDKYFLRVGESPVEQLKEQGYDFAIMNTFRTEVPRDRAFAVITGSHLYGWYRDNKLCGRCGEGLEHDTKERMLKCPACGNMIYPRINPAVIVGVTNKDKLLLTKYAGRTYRNYALVAGFAEIGETLEQTVAREVMEEVGLKVKNIRYYKSQPWAFSGSMLAGFYCDLDGDDSISLQEDELSLAEWVDAADLEAQDDNISLTKEMIVNFRREHFE